MNQASPGLQVIYVAAPYSSPFEQRIKRHIEKAADYGYKLTKTGLYAPYVPHPLIFAGIYGNDSSPAERAQGMQATMRIMLAIALNQGFLHILIEDGKLTEGTAAELVCWQRWNVLRANPPWHHVLLIDYGSLMPIAKGLLDKKDYTERMAEAAATWLEGSTNG